MATTGERYAAARRVLIAQAHDRPRTWVSEPELADDRIVAATGIGWDAWCDRIEAWPGHDDGHTAVAAWVHEHHDVTHWWAQAITVGWERITGRRVPNQMSDGTFTAQKSKTVPVDARELRAALLDESGRADLFPGHTTELRSKPTTKVLRVAFEEGSALFTISPRDDGRTTITVSHERLPDVEALERWKFTWTDWLDALADD